ncbi:MAG: hypothetical protein KDB18_10760 [Salinibacterium sp.]|nr:hypothetical protein [Salinibacterium sp.]
MDTNSLDQRVTRLEASARRWRLAAIGLGGVLVGFMVAGAGNTTPAPSEVKVVNWNELVGSNGAINEDGTFRTKSGSSPLAMTVSGGTLDTVKSVSQVGGEVTIKGAAIPGLPRGR